MSKALFSIFEAPITTPGKQSPAGDSSLIQIWRYIRGADARYRTRAYRGLQEAEREQQEAQLFKVAAFAGTFFQTGAAGLLQESGLICVSIDHTSEQDWDLKDLKDAVTTDPHLRVRLAFVSPSGDGLRVVLERPYRFSHSDYSAALLKYFAEAYFLEIDPAFKDISFLASLSYDPEAYYRD